MSGWKGFLEKSESYINRPNFWEKWEASLFNVDGTGIKGCEGWTHTDVRRTKQFILDEIQVYKQLLTEYSKSVIGDCLESITLSPANAGITAGPSDWLAAQQPITPTQLKLFLELADIMRTPFHGIPQHICKGILARASE